MRLSTFPDDAGYPAFRRNRQRGIWPLVRLNGEPVDGVMTADTKRGQVVVATRNAAGAVRPTARGGNVHRTQLSGRVAVEWVGRHGKG